MEGGGKNLDTPSWLQCSGIQRDTDRCRTQGCSHTLRERTDFFHIHHHLESKQQELRHVHRPHAPPVKCSHTNTHTQKKTLTKALSSPIQPESHVALAAISDPPGRGDAPAVQTEVAVGLADVGDVLGEGA